jgi:hypothetical protein
MLLSNVLKIILMKRLRLYYTIILLIGIPFFLSCNGDSPMKFDKTKWREKIDPAFPSPYRKRMLKDLLTNQKLVGLKYTQLTDLLGEPNFNDSSSLSYKIIVDYGYDIDPVYTKDLDFTFSKDSIITAIKVNEWKK